MIREYRKAREKKLETDISSKKWVEWNSRYIKTYKQAVGAKFKPKILDLGCGQDYFSKTCRKYGYEAEGIDIDKADFEKDNLPYKEGSFNVVHFNAVLEHLKNPDNIMDEIKRILGPGGIVIINTPNWQMDFKNFYNDPTHAKPYTPQSLRTLLQMYGFKVIFLEPALICKPRFYWKLPERIKWKVAARIRKGSKSILAIGEK
jgi:2-polyprenyl-3-methyl-5-hydroxy-6-metoxy-1,4-benzoquinol methylase